MTPASHPSEPGVVPSSGPGGPLLLTTRDALRSHRALLESRGERVALVPTMGYLHEGHMSLVDRAREVADHVILSIFVNPIQFGPDEDLERYPRDLEGDLDAAARRGVQAVFAPGEMEMYPSGMPTLRIMPGPPGQRLCGRSRPDHFPGVLTVVARLFGLVRPHAAVFGRKDLQQSVLVRQMTRDLELGVDIEVVPPVREADGLALSSRNAYLTPEERARAPELIRALENARARWKEGEDRAPVLVEGIRRHLDGVEGLRAEYVEAVSTEALEPRQTLGPTDALAAAVHLGRTRLIDNIVLGRGDT